MWLIANGWLVSFLTVSMSRLMATVVRNSDPTPPRPPSFDTAAASSADVHVPMGARMIGASIPNSSQSGVLSICDLPTRTITNERGHLPLKGGEPAPDLI